MVNLQYGFDLAAVGALQTMPGFLKVFGYEDPASDMGYAIDSTVQQLITSLLTLGSFVSSLVAGYFSAYFGRRQALWLACIINAIAVAIQIAAPSPGPLNVGRLLLGFANGFLVTFSNIYTAEASPAHMRGVIVALFAYWVNIGSILGAAVDNETKDIMGRTSYQVPLACLYIVPTMLFIALFLVPESPRWLLHRGDTQGARKALEHLRGASYMALRAPSTDGDREGPSLLEIEWAEMVKGVEEEQSQAGGIAAMDMFRGNASGIWFIIGYQTYCFAVSGITKAFEYSIMSTCFSFVGVNIGMYAIRNWVGHRTILIISAVTVSLCQLASAIAATVSPQTALSTGQVLVAFTALTKFFYNGCVGAASYPVATELVSSRLRAWTVGTTTSLGYLLAWLTNFCTPYFINPEHLNWGARYGYIWFGSNVASLVFFFFFIPEMKGRSLKGLDEMFGAKVAAREFKGYQCLIGEAARIDAVHAETKNIRDA
ncbi:general substrate transporter [Aspergillus germanicus]